MIKSRVLWGLWLVAAGGYWFFTDGYAGVLLLVLSLVLPLVLGVITFLGTKKMEFALQADMVGDKNQPFACGISLYNRSIVAQDRVVCTLVCRNLLTGEVYRPSVRLACGGRQEIHEKAVITSVHCGRVRVEVGRVTVYDPFGIFRFRSCPGGQALLLVRPQIFGMEAQIAYGESMSLDSEEYSMRKAGFDPSETFAIREYRAGDRPRQIHWKLSEKYDELMVRDYGLPIQNTILLLLETGSVPGGGKSDPDCMDALAQGLISLAQTLSEQQMVYSIGWQNHEEGSFTCVEITAQEELMSTMALILGAAAGEDAASVLDHYLEQRERCEFAHVILFTPHRQPDLQMISDVCLATEVVCESIPGGADTQDGVRRFGVSPKSMEADLAYLEI